MNYKTLTLTSGETVKVRSVSAIALGMAMSAVKVPEQPMKTVHVGSEDGGHDESNLDSDPNSPNYQNYIKALGVAERLRREKLNEASLLLGLPDVVPPADDAWFSRFAMVGIKPRDGEAGKLLDFIEFDLLAHTADRTAVIDTINELSYVVDEKAKALEDSFRRIDHDKQATTSAIGVGTEG